MNYLAHIHLAHHSNSSMVGNFLGDFIKGSELSYLSEEHQIGVRLHRAIDSFTDNHQDIVELRKVFPKALRRTSGIAVDVYFDHLLCRYWQAYSDINLDMFLQQFYTHLAAQSLPANQSTLRFQQVRDGLLKYQWLGDYQEIESCLRALLQIEKRFSKRISFAQQSIEVILQNEALFQQQFSSFYPMLMDYVQNKAQELSI